ncbi:MAG: mechanosensitive ion channel domain-containing protein [Armatimonadota bacterium]
MPVMGLDDLLPPDTWVRLVVGKMALFVVVVVLFYFIWLAVRQAIVAHAEGHDPDGTVTSRRVRIGGGIVGALGLLMAAQAVGLFGQVDPVGGLASGVRHGLVAATYVGFGALLAAGLVVAFGGRDAVLSMVVAAYVRRTAGKRGGVPKVGDHLTLGQVSGELTRVSLAHLHIRQATGEEAMVPACRLLTDTSVQGSPQAAAPEPQAQPQPEARRSIFDE